MVGSGSEMAADAEGDELVPVYRQQVTSTLRAALTQGRLTEDEYDERVRQASMSRSRAELVALLADLPVGRMNAPARPPTGKDAWTGVCVTIAATGVAAGILLWHPGNGGAFLVFIVAAVILLVTPIVTVGMMVDIRRQKRSGGRLSPGLTPSVTSGSRCARRRTRGRAVGRLRVG
jgi:hypothetical protein